MFYVALLLAALLWVWAMGLTVYGVVADDGPWWFRSLFQLAAGGVTVGALLCTVWVVTLA